VTERDDSAPRDRSKHLGSVRFDLEDKIAACLGGGYGFAGRESRNLLVRHFERRMGRALYVPEFDVPRDWIVAFVTECMDLPGGVSTLVETVRSLRANSFLSEELHRLSDAWDAIDVAEDAPEDLWQQLRTELTAIPLGSALDAYRFATGPRGDVAPTHCRTAWEMFLNTAGMNTGPHGVPPYVRFLISIGRLLDPKTDQLADQWNKKHVLASGRTAALELARLGAGIGRDPAQFYLVIQFDPTAAPRGQYEVTWWHQWGTEAVFIRRGRVRAERHSLEVVTARIVIETERVLAEQSVAIDLELILPLELIDEVVEAWGKTSGFGQRRHLVMDYPVVIRSLERLRKPELHRVWLQRWEQLTGLSRAYPSARCAPGDATSDFHLEASIAEDRTITAAVLSERPAPGGGKGLLEFAAAVSGGLPVVAWHRHSDATSTERDELRGLIDTGNPHELRHRARSANIAQLRHSRDLPPTARGDGAGNTTTARFIALLWDNPVRQPERASAGRNGLAVGGRHE
jgi:hypothetical protein